MKVPLLIYLYNFSSSAYVLIRHWLFSSRGPKIILNIFISKIFRRVSDEKLCDTVTKCVLNCVRCIRLFETSSCICLSWMRYSGLTHSNLRSVIWAMEPWSMIRDTVCNNFHLQHIHYVTTKPCGVTSLKTAIIIATDVRTESELWITSVNSLRLININDRLNFPLKADRRFGS